MLYRCECGISLPIKQFPFFCACGMRWDSPTSRRLHREFTPSTAHRVKRPIESHWLPLHAYAIKHESDWSADRARRDYAVWCRGIPSYGCSCRENWRLYTAEHPPVFDSPRDFFAWSVAGHNFVSANHVKPAKPELTLAQAYGVFRRSGELSKAPPLDLPEIDVVIPFYAGDRHFLAECVRAIYSQAYVRPIIHCIADGCEFPELGLAVHRYRTPGGWGPYRITNSLVAGGFTRSRYLAIQDVDDLSLPFRLWQQIATMREFGYEMVGGAMRNEPAAGYTGDRHLQEPILNSWRTYSSCPKGHLMNSTRLVSLQAFRAMNGFVDMICSADTDFCNRVVHLAPHESLPTFGASDIVAIRRLHDSSITNGGRYKMGTADRQATIDIVYANLAKVQADGSLAMARSLGGLERSRPLERIL